MEQLQGKYFYRQPRYYNQFSCIGSECTANCCFGWNIVWKKDEIDKVINARNCSPELKEIMNTCFVPQNEEDSNKFMVKFNNGMCPCQTEDKLCRIQKELGAGYLSHTCTIYPRYNVFVNLDNNSIYRGLYLSCQEVVRKLISNENAAELVNIQTKRKENFFTKYNDNHEGLSAHPEFKYRGQLLEFFYWLIGNRDCNLETSIILGALAAQKLTQIVESKQYDMIPEALKIFKKQVHDAAALKSIENIKPNYNISIGVSDNLINDITHLNITNIFKTRGGAVNTSRYATGEQALKDLMKDKPFWLRNIALTLTLELCVPFHSKEHTIFENYSFFVAAVSCIKTTAAAAALAPKKLNLNYMQMLHFDGFENIFCGLTSIISRRFCQDKTAFEKVTTELKKSGIKSPAYLALMIK